MTNIEKKNSLESEDDQAVDKADDSRGNRAASTSESTAIRDSNRLAELIGKAAAGLYFLSETDAEILPFIGQRTGSVSAGEIFRQTKIPCGTTFVERDFEDFFRHLTEIKSEATRTTQGFAGLKNVLEENLTDLRVFAIGQISIDIFLVGLNQDSVLMGIRTRAVET